MHKVKPRNFKVTRDDIQIATSHADAWAGNFVQMTSTGSGAAKAVRRTVRDLLARHRKGTPERKQTEAVIAEWLKKL